MENLTTMNLKNNLKKCMSKTGKFAKKHWKGIAIATCAIVVTLSFQTLTHNFISSCINQEIKFYDIGELSTECCETVEENFTFDSRKIPVIDVDIPFTERVENYTAEYKIKAGYNFKDITVWRIPFFNKFIVNMPSTQILSAELVDNSLYIKNEKKNIFNDFSLSDSYNSLQDMKYKAEEHAKNNGLYEKTRSGAESLLREKIKSEFGCSDSDIEFHFSDWQ